MAAECRAVTENEAKTSCNESLSLEPLPYHKAVRDFLKQQETALWDWFSKTRTQDEHAEAVKFDLLKRTVRIDADSDPKLYQRAERIARQLNLSVPVTFYQAQSTGTLNAAICDMVHEAHIIFFGPIQKRLDEQELDATIAHELGHLLLWQGWEKEFLIAELLLAALTRDAKVQPAHLETARLFRLHTEIFCDRCELAVVNDPLISISSLIKFQSDVEKIDPTSYLKQAREIIAKEKLGSDGITHPETYIRSIALHDWAEAGDTGTRQAVDSQIHSMIRGSLSLSLDLLGQQQMSNLTRCMMDALLKPQWFQTNLTIAHAKAFFPDYERPQTADNDEGWIDELKKIEDDKLQDYLVYIILDFVAADRDLEHAAIAWGLYWADRLGLKDRYVELTRKELRLRKQQISEIEKQRDSLIAKAKQQQRQQDSPHQKGSNTAAERKQ